MWSFQAYFWSPYIIKRGKTVHIAELVNLVGHQLCWIGMHLAIKFQDQVICFGLLIHFETSA